MLMSRVRAAAKRLILSSLLIAGGAAAQGCVGAHQVSRHPAELAMSAPSPVVWFGPTLASDAEFLSRWRRSVGPPVVVTGSGAPTPADRLIVVNWNVHVGGGDIARLVADLRRSSPGTPIVLLLQEAFREGPEVPSALDRNAVVASAIRGLRRDGSREEVESVARALDLHAYYVPSMRNGHPAISAEDRGNAILSTLPLDNLSAIELPFERQRRVAVSGTVVGTARDGRPWRLRVVSAHLDNMSGARRLWVAGSEFGRLRQARGLLSAVPEDGPMVLGGDMNTLFGFRDSAYREIARAFPQTQVTDTRATFLGVLRLDHLFFRLSDGWRAEFRRADDNYGSDHHPLIGTLQIEELKH